MAKNKKTVKGNIPATPPPSEKISPEGRRWVQAGGVLVVIGFLVLTRADALGRNWAAAACPFLILGGYALIAVGLFLPSGPPPAAGS